MKIKKLTLFNFRQFVGEQTIDFSTDEEKNVTVLVGDNTSGKTTLIRAFEWILYDNNYFVDKTLLNQNVADNMTAGEVQEVYGIIWLEHNGMEYEILRRQSYICIGNGKVRGGHSEPEISYMQPDGQTKTPIKSDFQYNIEKILPCDLSSYFFFGGERLAEITEKGDIAASVKGLMGLDVLYNAVVHLKNVINKLKKGLDLSKGEEVGKLQAQLEAKGGEVQELQREIKNVEEQLNYYRNEKEKYAALLKANENAAEDQSRRERLEHAIQDLKERIDRTEDEYVSIFSRDAFAFFGMPLLREAAKILDDARDEVESVPDMTSTSIDFLLERGYCICGKKIEKDSPLEASLLKERAKQPPEAIGSLVRRFKEQAMEYMEVGEQYEEKVQLKYRDIKDLKEELGRSIDDKEILDERLKGRMDIAHLEMEYKKSEIRIHEFEDKMGELREQIGACKRESSAIETKLNQYILNDNKNEKILLQIDYAAAVQEWVQKAYDEKEKIIRERLEEKVNENFQKIYHGSRKIMIDEKYRVKYFDVTTDESDGLKAVKNLAFVSGLVDLAKEALELNGTVDVGPLYYPLVMDGPFSNIDAKHIENISKILPEAAEQVIIALMEKDWERASLIMAPYVGKTYEVVKDRERNGKEIETISHVKEV